MEIAFFFCLFLTIIFIALMIISAKGNKEMAWISMGLFAQPLGVSILGVVIFGLICLGKWIG